MEHERLLDYLKLTYTSEWFIKYGFVSEIKPVLYHLQGEKTTFSASLLWYKSEITPG